VLYQLSYVRIIVSISVPHSAFPRVPTSKNSIGGSGILQIAAASPRIGGPGSLQSSEISELQSCNSYGFPALPQPDFRKRPKVG
jgi:hypothetical protein